MRITHTLFAATALCGLLASGAARAEKVANPVAVFMGLDKITGSILTFDAYIDETVRFGSVLVKPRVCYTRPPTEPAQTDAFVEVYDKELSGNIKKIFSGWMFASSPGLNGVEHPVDDVWLLTCSQTSDVAKPADLSQVRDAVPSTISGVAKAIGPGFEIPPIKDLVNGTPPPPDPGTPADAPPED